MTLTHTLEAIMPNPRTPKANDVAKSLAVFRQNIRDAKRVLGQIPPRAMASLEAFSREFCFSVRRGDLQMINGNWYVTHSGLVALARRKKCCGIKVETVDPLCDPASNRFVLKATVYPSQKSSGFVGYGDADPYNVSFLVHGAEMRVAETRAVNRALRKAYGIGICSVEEIGSFERQSDVQSRFEEATPRPCQWQRERKSHSPRSALPGHPPASAGSEPGQVLRD